MNEKKLYRDTKNKAISGVCAGLAKYLNMDVSVVRVLTVLLALFAGAAVLAYIICIFVIPEEPADNNIVDGTVQDDNTNV